LLLRFNLPAFETPIELLLRRSIHPPKPWLSKAFICKTSGSEERIQVPKPRFINDQTLFFRDGKCTVKGYDFLIKAVVFWGYFFHLGGDISLL
jgi:hypothetical protein